ncbi:hypothetical protein ACHQM5_022654 [Ranunculus cassubicifolius]
MSISVDHYQSLGLPTWEEGTKLTLPQITEAYKRKALEFHAGKLPDLIFQKIKRSYQILKDENSRRYFDEELIRVKQEQQRCDSKRKKPIENVVTRKRVAPDPRVLKEREEEELFRQNHKKEIEEIMAMCSRNSRNDVLRASWEGSEDAYSLKYLKELFEKFGEVRYVEPEKASKKLGNGVYYRFIHMKTRDAAVSAMRGVRGDSANPLTVSFLGQSIATRISSPFDEKQDELLRHLFRKDAEAA